MSISQVRVLPVGNALQVFLEPPPAAEFWRVLRNTTGVFAAFDDPDAFVVHDGTDRAPIDSLQLINGITYHYAAFYWDGSAWSLAPIVTGVPQATFADASVDVKELLRHRLESALSVEVQRGVLEHENGGIPVLVAPPSFEDTRWPVVTLHLNSDAPNVRALGETMFPDLQDPVTGDYLEGEGYLSAVSITVCGWSLNADERETLRKALRRAVVANFPIFAEHGINQVEFSAQDVEDFNSYSAPVYQAMCTFTCIAPVFVTDSAEPVVDVEVKALEP